jgi:hypothetical protein
MNYNSIGQIRPSQLVTTFGPGAIVDLRDDSAMVTAIDFWPEGREFNERFLEERLGVQRFQIPRCEERFPDIPVVPFPDHHVCPKCRRIVNLSKMPPKRRAKRGPGCPHCSSGRYTTRTYPARLLVVCPRGHIDDFPWSWWVHGEHGCAAGSGTDLKLTSSGSTSTLSDLWVRCEGCGKARSLTGAVGGRGLKGWTCSGRRPWIPGQPPERCDLVGGERGPRGSLRGATNLYFSSVVSQLSIPPFSDPLEKELDSHRRTLDALLTQPDLYRTVARTLLQGRGFEDSEIGAAIEKRLSGLNPPSDPRNEEYNALRTPPRGMLIGDFRSRKGTVPDGFHLESVVLVEKLREVRALVGFSRIDAPDPEQPEAVSSIRPWNNRPNWLPGAELRGEGLFFQVDEERLQRWEQLPEVQKRAALLLSREAAQRAERGWSEVERRPGFLMLHTFAHVLINVLALECGYSSTSLRERIYANPRQNGVLIYTGTVDSDGSLGGLIRQGAPDRLPGILRRSLDYARLCSGDPLCRERSPETLTDSLNGVACHACCLVSETSCEHRNNLLDRALLVDLPDTGVPGFFSDGF